MRVFTNERQRLEERRLSSSFDVLSGTLARQKTHPLYYNCDPSTVCVIRNVRSNSRETEMTANGKIREIRMQIRQRDAPRAPRPLRGPRWALS